GEQGGKRGARTATFIDQGLRQTSAQGETAAESSNEIRSPKCQKFLACIKPSAVLGCEHAANRRRFHRAKNKAGKRQRQQIVQIGPMNSGRSDGWQALWHFAKEFYSARIQGQHGRRDNAANDDE